VGRALVFDQPLRELLDALGPEHAREVRGASAGGRHDRPGQRHAQLLGHLIAALERSVVRVQRAAAALAARHRALGDQLTRGAADPRIQNPLEAPEHEVHRPRRIAAAAGVPAHDPERADAPRRADRPHQRPHLPGPAPPVPQVVTPLLQQRAVLDARGAHRLARAAAQAERRFVEDGGIVVLQHARLERPHQVDAPAGR
jgi:hypothetical protein